MDLQLSQEEIDLILKRRELTVKRQARGPVSAVNRVVEEVKPAPKKAVGDVNGRITDPSHPLHFFESQIFSKLGNVEHENLSWGKAGRSRWYGWRPASRAVVKNPVDHPMGGGEGRSSGGRHPCSRSGQLAKGLKTRKRSKITNKYIVMRRPK